jgi:hypothetical protein
MKGEGLGAPASGSGLRRGNQPKHQANHNCIGWEESTALLAELAAA